MKKTLLAAFAIAIVLPTAPVLHPAHAASGVQRCEASDGTSIYTDKPCATLGARPAPMSGELVARLASAQAAGAPSSLHATPFAGAYADAAQPLHGPGDAMNAQAAVSRRSAAAGCARTPTQLAMDLRGAFAIGDVNRIAESYHWVGMGTTQATHVMQRLDGLSNVPVTDTRYFDASIHSASAGWTNASAAIDDGNGSAGILQLVQGDGTATKVLDFDVLRYAGCYFVEF